MRKTMCLILSLSMLISLCACGESNASNRTTSEPDAAGPQSSDVVNTAGVNEPEEDPNSVGLDGTIEGDCFSISIVDVKWTDALETSLGTVAPENEGTKLLCLIFSAKNTTEDTKNLGSFNSYVDKQATLPTVVVGGIDDAVVFVGAVAGGMETKAYWVLELPEDWEEVQLNYFEASGPECKQHFVIRQEDIPS